MSPVAFFEPGEERALNNLRGAMDKFNFGTNEYELARRAFAHIANKVRVRQKLYQEHERGLDEKL